MDITVLTETKRKGQGSENLGHYDHFYSGIPKDKRAQQGVSILVRKNLRRYITSWEAVNQRIIKLNLCLCGNKITIIGVYAVSEDAPVKEKEEFYEQLSYEISVIGTAREIILLGDFNARTGRKKHDRIIGQFGEEILNDNGMRLINLCDQNNLRVVNGFFEHREIHKFTWTQHSRNLKSIIDYLIVRQNTKLKIQDVRVYRGATCGSDHHLVKAKILSYQSVKRVNNEEEREKEQQRAEIRFNLDNFNHESVKELYRKRLDEKLTQENFENTEHQYTYIKDCLKSAAQEALGLYETSKRKKPYWWDDEIEEMINTKNDKHKVHLCKKTDQSKTDYQIAQKKVRTAITQKKNESWERNCARINTYLGGSKSTESWKLLKSLRQDNKKDIITPVTLQKWDEYFGKLLTENREAYKKQEPEPRIEIRTLASPIRVKSAEVKQICQNLKNRKSPGPGNIPPELLKYGTDKLYRQLTSLFQKCLNGENIPEEWRTSYITTIHKKGSKDICDNYRGIAVLSSISRVYGKLVKRRIEDEYRDIEAEEQAGFRAGRSTTDHLFTITQIIEKKLARNQEVHLLFVDLKKAYDSIPQIKLWEALEKTNVNVTLIRAVQELYKNNTSKIKQGHAMSKGFNINKGLKQGCCLSPTLFKIYLEQALKLWKGKCRNMGIPLNDGYTLYTLCFADDQVVLAQDYEDLEYMTRKLTEEYDKWGLQVNVKKTEYMCVGGEQRNLLLEQQEQIKHTRKYKYLGVHITCEGSMDEEIRYRNNLGRQAIRKLNNILWDKTISKDNKHKIYNSIVKSIVSYGSEVWPLKENALKMIEATEMDYWRRAAGKSKLDKVRNEKIREIMGTKHNLTEDIRVNQLRWYGHVQRMEQTRIPRKVLDWTPYGRRKRGRPRLSWREGVEKDIQAREIEENLCTDRDRWKLEIRKRRRTL